MATMSIEGIVKKEKEQTGTTVCCQYQCNL